MINNKPKINIRLQNKTFKVLEIIGLPGDVLASHRVDQDAVLQVMSGSIDYKESNIIKRLVSLETQSIKKKQLHSLEFIEESKLLLFLFSDTKMKFEAS